MSPLAINTLLAQLRSASDFPMRIHPLHLPTHLLDHSKDLLPQELFSPFKSLKLLDISRLDTNVSLLIRCQLLHDSQIVK